MIFDIAAGYRFTCVLIQASRVDDSKGSPKCFGMNISGQLGYGDVKYRGDKVKDLGKNLPSVNIGNSVLADSISTGTDHVCVRAHGNKQLKCWGKNDYGNLGQSDTNNRGDEENEMGDFLPFVSLGTGRTVQNYSLGSRHTCAILDDASVKCFGGNNYGQLGLGDTNNRGDQVNEMGDKLPAINFGIIGLPVTNIECGYWHSCALFSNSKVKCFGDGEFGRLGYNRYPRIGDDPNEMGDNLPFVDVGTSRLVLSMSAGAFHTCFFLENFSIKCFGGNQFGQLGQGDTQSRGDDPNEMGNNLLPINFGIFDSIQPSSMIALMDFGTCVVMLDDKGVKCFGANEEGQLGIGDNLSRGDEPGEMGDNLTVVSLANDKITKITAGSKHACTLFKNKKVKCWGFNYDGELGLGNTRNYGMKKSDMGKRLPYIKVR